MESAALRHQLRDRGFAVVPDVLDAGQVERCVRSLAGTRVRRSSGVRNLLSAVPGVAWVAEESGVRRLAEGALGAGARVVRSILFDKVEGANWSIRWHQDKTIAVRRRRDVDGYGPWSMKSGVVSVQPPVGVLERMVSIRLHLDHCPASHGALRVVPGSHRLGKLDFADAAAHAREEPHVCEVGRGGALVMRPLLLHSSAPSTVPSHRRVIHLDFSSSELDGGLEWAEGA